MTELSGLLEDPAALFARLKVPTLEPKALRKASAALVFVDDGSTISEIDVAGLQLKAIAAAKAGEASRLSRRELREVCRAYLQAPHPPGGDRPAASAILDLVQSLQRRAAFFSLIEVYLDRFSADDDAVGYLAERLTGLSLSWPWRPTDEWPARTNAFALFNPQKAPQKLGDAVLKGEGARGVLLLAGLNTEGRVKGGLAEAAFRSACASIFDRSGATVIPLQSKLIEWAQLDGEKLVYPRAWPEFAGALFRPWGGVEPPKAHQHQLLDAALGYGGDPRVNRARWRPVQDATGDAYSIALRWLTKASVEQFFDIVAQTTDRPDMWAERRRFWTDYLKKDMISSAWVVFGSGGAARAERAARASGDAGLMMFGRLEPGNGKTSEHAALIMNLGDISIVEWSHNGKWNLWRKGEPRIPEMFRQNKSGRYDYSAHELMYAHTSGSHQSGWQSTLRETIRRATGLRP